MDQQMALWKQPARWAGVLVVIMVLATSVQAAILKEIWYMSRGKANMKIKNYRAAIEAFEKLVEIDADNQTAMRLLGLAYEKQGLTSKAVEHYDRYLKRFPQDAAIAFKQARFLEWSRFAYRRQDAVKYYRMGLSVRDNPEKRHRLAKLLAQNKTTIDDALEAYRQLVKQDPHNMEISREYRKLLLWDGRFLEEAISEFERVAELYPDNFALKHRLAKLYLRDDAHSARVIRIYAELVAAKPNHTGVREEYARALASNPGHFQEACDQFKWVLAKRGRYATRLAYADLLAQESSTREEALVQYQHLLKQKPGRYRVRLSYATLLGGQKSDLDRAIAQYKIILKKHPQNVRAQQGIAHAYAWKGDNDQAVYHSNLALKYQPRNSDAAHLRATMMEGREPRLRTHVRLFNQVGEEDDFDLHGFIVKSGYSRDITPFIWGEGQIGYEKFWKGDTRLTGGLYHLGLQYRPDPRQRWNLSYTWHAFNQTKSSHEFNLNYVFDRNQQTLALGLQRRLKYDSLLALGRSMTRGPAAPKGAARSNMAYSDLVYRKDRLTAKVKPYLGVVQTRAAGHNWFGGLETDLAYQLLNQGPWQISAQGKLRLDHYQKDYSGFTDQDAAPYAGGYFSPRFFANNTFLMEIGYSVSKSEQVTLLAGPGLHYVKEDTDSHDWSAQAILSYLRQLQDSLYLKAEGEYSQVADTYRRITFSAVVSYRF